MFCFVDTETSGLVSREAKKYPIMRADDWPIMLEISWMLVYPDSEIYEIKNMLVKPPDYFNLQPKITELTGISENLIRDKGIDMSIVAEEFNRALKHAKAVIAHNVDFDAGVIISNFHRQNLDYSLINRIHKICTVQLGTNVCKIPNPKFPGSYKWPKLSELYKFLFNKDLEQKHRALDDVMVLKDCYFELRKRGSQC